MGRACRGSSVSLRTGGGDALGNAYLVIALLDLIVLLRRSQRLLVLLFLLW